MYLLESPDGTFSRPDWQLRDHADSDWNTISVPNANSPSGYTALQRHQVQLVGEQVEFELAGIPSVDGQRLAAYPDAAELARLLLAGHTISPGPTEAHTAALADCKFWLLTDQPVGRDN